MMPTLKPLDGSLVEALWYEGVAKASVLHALLQGLHDAWRCLEVHVCHPHWYDVSLGHFVPFHAVGVATIYLSIKVVGHRS
jgi:hypothetical protein